MSNTLIELHVPDFERAKTFYGKLGFGLLWEESPQDKRGYMVLKLEKNLLAFWGGNDQIYQQSYFSKFPRETAPGFGVELILQVERLKDYYNLVSQRIEISEPLRMRAWGLEDFRFVDPFGFYFRVNECFDLETARPCAPGEC